MTDPARLRSARETCRRLGYRLTTEDRTIARPGEDARSILNDSVAPIVPEAVTDPTPLAVLTAVGRAAREGQACLFAPATESDAREIAGVLRTPTGAEAADDSRCRQLYAGPDRVHVEGGGLALYDAGDSFGRPTFEWYEEPEGTVAGRSGTDRRRLVLAADGDPVAVLPGTDALRCPGPDPSSFEFRYERKSDGLFHVAEPDGRSIGVFSGVTAMREQGFHPIPAPVVPDRHLPGPVRENWAVLHPDGDRVLTASGDRELPL